MKFNGEVRGLLQEAAEWRLIGLLFECPAPGWVKEAKSLALELEDPLLGQATEEALREGSEGLYHSIFGPGGPAPPREASYQDTVQLGYLIAEIESYYNAFAYRPRCAEATDHVATESGFVSYLKLKRAYALADGRMEEAAVSGEAASRFVEDHLSMMAEPLAASLSQSGVAYLRDAAQALLARTGPRRTLPVLQEPVVDGEDYLECGA